ncbi:beta-ketoacyl-ACP synthase [Uliginosibacterium sp. sgz301328]|uniref:beta-ketoacyl-ACP synthase n=1 Tax=Uliginosibacterium sp. sgz301328 TaxID=3243764 RepID=UPI00359D879B
MTQDFFLNDCGVICALGAGKDAVREALFNAAGPGGVAPSEAFLGRRLHVGAVNSPLPDLSHLPVELRGRNNGLVLAAANEIRASIVAVRERFGAARVAVVMGTSTTGIGEAEAATRVLVADGHYPPAYHYAQQELGSTAQVLAREFDLRGPCYTVSTACSSSAKSLISAARLLSMGLADAVVCGGADSLCGFTIAGFSSLELISAERCNPMSRNRAGINIGEAAALFVMTREPGGARLSGWGESSDAHHISAPDPSGRGAIEAMTSALSRAGLTADDVDYLNMHGTATPQNDAVESAAIAQVFGTEVPCSSTKPLTGHTLGAAGALGAAFAWLVVQSESGGRLPPHWYDNERDEALASIHLVSPGERTAHTPRHVLANTFAFGGNNASLIVSAA